MEENMEQYTETKAGEDIPTNDTHIDFDLKDNMDAAGAYRLYAELIFGDGSEKHPPKITAKGRDTARKLLRGAAARLERTTRHLEFWVRRFKEMQEEEE